MAGLLIADFSSFFDISIGLHELKTSYLNVQFCVWCDSFSSEVDRRTDLLQSSNPWICAIEPIYVYLVKSRTICLEENMGSC